MKEGILLIDKPPKITSFRLVEVLRRITKIKKIGHAGTLDPISTGLMVMLIGRKYTKLFKYFRLHEKEYQTSLKLGISTDTYDITGRVTHNSSYLPSRDEISLAIEKFQGFIWQLPPMFSAKKVKGKKLCNLARRGEIITRSPAKVELKINITGYNYPTLDLHLICSSGTYVRSLANDLGKMISTYGVVANLRRIRIGPFLESNAIPLDQVENNDFDYKEHLICQDYLVA